LTIFKSLNAGLKAIEARIQPVYAAIHEVKAATNGVEAAVDAIEAVVDAIEPFVDAIKALLNPRAEVLGCIFQGEDSGVQLFVRHTIPLARRFGLAAGCSRR